MKFIYTTNTLHSLLIDWKCFFFKKNKPGICSYAAENLNIHESLGRVWKLPEPHRFDVLFEVAVQIITLHILLRCLWFKFIQRVTFYCYELLTHRRNCVAYRANLTCTLIVTKIEHLFLNAIRNTEHISSRFPIRYMAPNKYTTFRTYQFEYSLVHFEKYASEIPGICWI